MAPSAVHWRNNEWLLHSVVCHLDSWKKFLLSTVSKREALGGHVVHFCSGKFLSLCMQAIWFFWLSVHIFSRCRHTAVVFNYKRPIPVLLIVSKSVICSEVSPVLTMNIHTSVLNSQVAKQTPVRLFSQSLSHAWIRRLYNLVFHSLVNKQLQAFCC